MTYDWGGNIKIIVGKIHFLLISESKFYMLLIGMSHIMLTKRKNEVLTYPDLLLMSCQLAVNRSTI